MTRCAVAGTTAVLVMAACGAAPAGAGTGGPAAKAPAIPAGAFADTNPNVTPSPNAQK